MGDKPEVKFNKALAKVLETEVNKTPREHLTWGVEAEPTVSLVNDRGEKMPDKVRPDILVETGASGLNVIIEAEFEKASSVEDDAQKKLGLKLALCPLPTICITRVIALYVPRGFKETPEGELERAIRSNKTTFAACLFLQEQELLRLPREHRIEVNFVNLARVITLTALAEDKNKIEELKKYINDLPKI